MMRAPVRLRKGSGNRRADRHAARGLLWSLSQDERLRDCGRVSVVPGGGVHLRVTGEGNTRAAGYAGLSTCGRVWSCPCCSARILAGRADDVQRAVAAWSSSGGRLALVTLTIRHDASQPLAQLWDSVQAAWRRVIQGRAWKATRARLGVAGQLRVTEVTHGRHGWHVHLHVLVFLEAGTAPADVVEAQLRGALVPRWVDACAAVGAVAYAHGGAQDVRVLDVGPGRDPAGYLNKGTYSALTWDAAGGVALEVSRADLKAGRAGNRTAFQLLAHIVGSVELTGEVPALELDLWLEWEAASRGRRQAGWSPGLRDRLGLGAELSDDELAAVELGSAVDDVVAFTSDAWRQLRRHPRRLAQLLDVAESAAGDPRPAVLSQLGEWGVSGVEPVARATRGG